MQTTPRHEPVKNNNKSPLKGITHTAKRPAGQLLTYGHTNTYNNVKRLYFVYVMFRFFFPPALHGPLRCGIF